MARSRSPLAALALLAVAALWASPAFLPAPQPSDAPALRGASASVAAAALAAGPLAAIADKDSDYLDYPFLGEIRPIDVAFVMGGSTGLMLFAFASYFILTKLQII